MQNRSLTVHGYASVFHKCDRHNHVMLPGAFAQSVAQFRQNPQSIKLLWQHDQKHPIGRITHLEEDDYGLKMTATILPVTRQSRDALQLLSSQCVHQLSVGCRPVRSIKKGKTLVISEAVLFEVSIATIPANEWAIIYKIDQHIGEN